MKTLIASLLVTLCASVAQADFSNVSSGMLLGIYSQPCGGGMKVTSLIPGYSAEGRIFPGDIIKRVAVPAGNGAVTYLLRSHYEMEKAKSAIGPNRDAALEIYRPGVGLTYVWVQFSPLYGPAAATAGGTHKARFKTEREKPGARNLFQSKSGNIGFPRSSGGRPQGNTGAARHFGRQPDTAQHAPAQASAGLL